MSPITQRRDHRKTNHHNCKGKKLMNNTLRDASAMLIGANCVAYLSLNLHMRGSKLDWVAASIAANMYIISVNHIGTYWAYWPKFKNCNGGACRNLY